MSDEAASPVVKKRRNAAKTKDAILEAALIAFSTQGYPQTGLREIAERAGINVALIGRYFGSKLGLFEAALIEALDLERLMAGGRKNFGTHAAALLNNPRPVNSAAMTVLAMSDTEARAVAVELLEERIIATIADWLGAPDAEARAAEITILCTGFLIYREHLPLASLSSGPKSSAVEWLARSLQEIVDRR